MKRESGFLQRELEFVLEFLDTPPNKWNKVYSKHRADRDDRADYNISHLTAAYADGLSEDFFHISQYIHWRMRGKNHISALRLADTHLRKVRIEKGKEFP